MVGKSGNVPEQSQVELAHDVILDLKGYFKSKKYTTENEQLCERKFCIGHKTGDGVH